MPSRDQEKLSSPAAAPAQNGSHAPDLFLFGKPLKPAAPLEADVVEGPTFDPRTELHSDSGDVIDVEYEVLREAPRTAHQAVPTLRLAPAQPLPPRQAKPAKPKTEDLASAILDGDEARDLVHGVGEGHGLAPAPRHRKRLILKWLRDMEFADCLDASTHTPGLLDAIAAHKRLSGGKVVGFGCVAPGAQAPRATPDQQFLILDPMRQSWPGGRKFDLVICAETLALADDWRLALKNLVAMTRRYLLITAPGGPIRTADRVAGHRRHFDALEIAGATVGHGLTLLRQRQWGFPMHSLLQETLEHLQDNKLTGSLATHPDSLPMRLIDKGLYLALFSNDLFHGGFQHMLLAERKPA